MSATALAKYVGMVLGEARELPDGTTALGFYQPGFSQRPWRWVSTVTGTTADEWIAGHLPTNRRHPSRSRLDVETWAQHQIDIGDDLYEREREERPCEAN